MPKSLNTLSNIFVFDAINSVELTFPLLLFIFNKATGGFIYTSFVVSSSTGSGIFDVSIFPTVASFFGSKSSTLVITTLLSIGVSSSIISFVLSTCFLDIFSSSSFSLLSNSFLNGEMIALNISTSVTSNNIISPNPAIITKTNVVPSTSNNETNAHEVVAPIIPPPVFLISLSTLYDALILSNVVVNISFPFTFVSFI